jgi:peptidoglycan-associated lipoprotein
MLYYMLFWGLHAHHELSLSCHHSSWCHSLFQIRISYNDLSDLDMQLLDLKKQLVGVSVLITLGLCGCSSPNVNSETSSASESVLQTSRTEASIASKSAEDNLSSVVLLTYFDFDSAALSAETTMVLDGAVDKFAAHPSALVVISGHADERGTREYNLALGHLRASAVNDYMVARGIAGSRIKKVSYGKERPLLKGSNEEAWSKNRRVEINGE